MISYQVVNRGRTTVELGLPPFEVKTGDGQRFPANAMLSMLYPMEQAERSGSLQVMADAVNPELHPGLGGTYQVAFALTQDASRQHLFLIAKGPWLGFPETAVTLK